MPKVVQVPPETMEVESNTATLPDTKPEKNGYIFLGWADSEKARSVQYKPGETITLSDNTTLYAVYKVDKVTPFPVPETGIGAPVSSSFRYACLMAACLVSAIALGKKR